MTTTDRRRREAAQRQADDWNRRHRVGTPVRYWRGIREGEGLRGRTKSPAFLTYAGTPVLMITDCRGCVAVSHVEPAETAEGVRP